jgi:hypothetical protein
MATFVGNHVTLELTDTMEAAGARTIIMHELTHALYDVAARAKHQALIGQFAASAEPRAQSYYQLLNEGLATGLQFMLLRRAGLSDKDGYRHDYIPRMGRAASPLLEQALSDPRATLFSGFAERYLRAAAEEMKEEAKSPKFALMALALAKVGKAGMDAAEQAFRTEFPAISGAGFDDRQKFPELNLVTLVPYSELSAVSENWPEVEEIAKEQRGFALVAPRGSKGLTFLVAGRDEADVVETLRKLAAAASMPDRGVVVSLK